MANVTVPDGRERQILMENGTDPKDFGVMHKDADSIRCLNYATRDIITIWKGDRKW